MLTCKFLMILKQNLFDSLFLVVAELLSCPGWIGRGTSLVARLMPLDPSFLVYWTWRCHRRFVYPVDWGCQDQWLCRVWGTVFGLRSRLAIEKVGLSHAVPLSGTGWLDWVNPVLWAWRCWLVRVQDGKVCQHCNWSFGLMSWTTVLLFSNLNLAGVTSRAAFRVTDRVASTLPCDVLMLLFRYIGSIVC